LGFVQPNLELYLPISDVSINTILNSPRRARAKSKFRAGALQKQLHAFNCSLADITCCFSKSCNF
jgi:hypothetical protein